MNRQDFMSEVYRQVSDFETRWNKGQRGESPHDWPNELEPEDWWEQLIAHLEMSGKI